MQPMFEWRKWFYTWRQHRLNYMAKQLIDGVNEILKKVDILEGDTGLLTTLTDSARQVFIDTAIQSLNEVLDELYSISVRSKPQQLRSATVTLTTSVTANLDANIVTLRKEYHLVDRSNNHIIYILDDTDDGYRSLILGDLEQDDTGLPSYAAIDPTGVNRIRFDRKPTASESGRIYTYHFDTDLELTLAADAFPFSNTVFRAVVPAAAELWKLHRHQEFSQGIFNASMGRASRLFTMTPISDSYRPGHNVHNLTDPVSE